MSQNDLIGTPYEKPTRYVGPQSDLVPVRGFPRIPLTTDKKYPLAQFALITKNPSTGTQGDLYYLKRFESNGDATWVKLNAAGSGNGLQTLTTDSGTATIDVSDNINLLGASAQGVSTSASGADATITVADATTSSKGVIQADGNDFVVSSGTLSLANDFLDGDITFNADSGSATTATNALTVSGSGSISTSGSGSTLTIAGSGVTTINTSTGGPVTVSGNAITINGTANEIDVTGSGSTITIGLVDPLTETKGGTGQSTYSTGDILYASGANTLSKLAAGSNGEVLTLAAGVPSWAVAGAGTIVLDPIETQTVSGVSSINFTTLSTDYYAFMLMFRITVDNDGAEIHIRTSTNGGSSYDSGSSDYTWAITENGTGRVSATSAEIKIIQEVGNTGDEFATGVLWLIDPHTANDTAVVATCGANSTSGSWRDNNGGGCRLQSTAVDAFQIKADSGNIDGTVQLYGLKAPT